MPSSLTIYILAAIRRGKRCRNDPRYGSPEVNWNTFLFNRCIFFRHCHRGQTRSESLLFLSVARCRAQAAINQTRSTRVTGLRLLVYGDTVAAPECVSVSQIVTKPRQFRKTSTSSHHYLFRGGTIEPEQFVAILVRLFYQRKAA